MATRTNMSARLLVVDRDSRYAEWLRHHLGVLLPDATVNVLNLSDFNRWSTELSGSSCDVLMLGVPFGTSPEDPQAQGLELLRQLRDKTNFPAVIAVAEEGNELTAVRALQLGAVDYLPKRLLTPERLKTAVKLALRLIEKRVARRIAVLAAEAENARSSVDTIAKDNVSSSPKVVARSTPGAAAPSDSVADDDATNSLEVPALEQSTSAGSSAGGAASLDSGRPSDNGADRGADRNASDRSPAPWAAANTAPTADDNQDDDLRFTLNGALGPNIEAVADASAEAGTATPAATQQAGDAKPESPATAPVEANAATAAGNGQAKSTDGPITAATDTRAPNFGSSTITGAAKPNSALPKKPTVTGPPSPTPLPAASAPGGEFMPASFIPGYTIHATIGESEKAAVYVATSAALGKNVALKVSKTLRDEAAGRQFLEREYTAIVAIRDPSVVQIYDYGVHAGYEYLVMEYLPKGDLKSRMQQGLTDLEALRYLEFTAAALQVVHQAGLLHRDLKPPNVMLRENGNVALIDFGLARALDGSTPSTRVGVLRGSPYYMSPEQAMGEILDARSDFYSLGIMFYEMLTGRRPYTGGSAMDVLQQHVNAPLPQLPKALVQYEPLILKLLAKSREQRYRSAAELLDAVAEVRGKFRAEIRDSAQVESSAA